MRQALKAEDTYYWRLLLFAALDSLLCFLRVSFRQLSDTGTVELESGETHLGLPGAEGCNSRVCESYTGEF